MLKEAIKKLTEREDLTAEQARSAMNEIMSGEVTPAQIAAFLIAMRMKGETVEEITGCARVLEACRILAFTRLARPNILTLPITFVLTVLTGLY